MADRKKLAPGDAGSLKRMKVLDEDTHAGEPSVIITRMVIGKARVTVTRRKSTSDQNGEEGLPRDEITRRSDAEDETTIVVSPLAWLTSITRIVLTPELYKQLVEPRVIQTYDLYFEALKDGRTTFARWVIVRGVLLLGRSIFEVPLHYLAEMFNKEDKK